MLSFVDFVDELQRIPKATDESFKHTCKPCCFVLIMHSYACALYTCVLEGVCEPLTVSWFSVLVLYYFLNQEAWFACVKSQSVLLVPLDFLCFLYQIVQKVFCTSTQNLCVYVYFSILKERFNKKKILSRIFCNTLIWTWHFTFAEFPPRQAKKKLCCWSLSDNLHIVKSSQLIYNNKKIAMWKTIMTKVFWLVKGSKPWESKGPLIKTDGNTGYRGGNFTCKQMPTNIILNRTQFKNVHKSKYDITMRLI